MAIEESVWKLFLNPKESHLKYLIFVFIGNILFSELFFYSLVMNFARIVT